MTKAAGSLETTPAGIKLWAHETLRVFYDRLVDDPDRLWLGRLLIELTEKHFKERLTSLLGLAGLPASSSAPAAAAAAPAAGAAAPAGGAAVGVGSGLPDEELLTGLRGLMFGDFMVPGADVRVYRWVSAIVVMSQQAWQCCPTCLCLPYVQPDNTVHC
jgi:dynein heavy chain